MGSLWWLGLNGICSFITITHLRFNYTAPLSIFLAVVISSVPNAIRIFVFPRVVPLFVLRRRRAVFANKLCKRGATFTVSRLSLLQPVRDPTQRHVLNKYPMGDGRIHELTGGSVINGDKSQRDGECQKQR